MNIADFTILVILATSAITGLFEGLMRSVLSLFAWLLSFGIALGFVSQLAYILVLFVPIPDLRISLALLVLFVGTFAIMLWLNYLIIRSVGYIELSAAERWISLFFGIVRGGVFVTFLVLLAGLSQIPTMTWWQQSLLIKDFQDIAALLRSLLPVEIAEQFSFTVPSK
ncbi:MAG: hypothetical protein BWK79_17035 [Beggiatoa sp. IS2]|nr:MAG: hypothetical protein BWK79_17035 [Beggiatoa sp. IS2]